MSKPTKRELPKQKYLKHPFTRGRLAIIDEFKPVHDVACPKCNTPVEAIIVVEPEVPGGPKYHVMSCQPCGDKKSWVVLTGRANAQQQSQ